MFFIPYSLFEVPSNVVLKMLRPSRWLATLVVLWGTVVCCMGTVHNYHGLLITRIFLGVTEAGFFPAATFLIGEWYCRYETQTRMAIFYTAASLAGAFSGLLAFAIQKMNGLAGISGWRWIFILEGALTVASGLTIPFILPDSPEQASWLTVEEKKFLRHRLEQDSGTKEGRVETLDHFKLKYLVAALTDWKIWFTIFIYWGNTVPIYAFSFTAPTIIYDLGYTAAQAQLLTIPIYLLAVCSVLFFSRIADRKRTRWPFIVGPYCLVVIGFIALLAIPHPKYPGLTYAFLFLIPAGCNPGVITLVTWISNNLAPTSKRATGLALSLMMANLGGAIGSNIYLVSEKPRYWTGYGVCLCCTTVGICCTMVLRWAYKSQNLKRDKMSEEEIRAKYTERELFLSSKSFPDILTVCRTTARYGRQVPTLQICVLDVAIVSCSATRAGKAGSLLLH